MNDVSAAFILAQIEIKGQWIYGPSYWNSQGNHKNAFTDWSIVTEI